MNMKIKMFLGAFPLSLCLRQSIIVSFAFSGIQASGLIYDHVIKKSVSSVTLSVSSRSVLPNPATNHESSRPWLTNLPLYIENYFTQNDFYWMTGFLKIIMQGLIYLWFHKLNKMFIHRKLWKAKYFIVFIAGLIKIFLNIFLSQISTSPRQCVA